MLTNVFTPHVGGVARSVAAFSTAYRQAGHQVLVVAPCFEHMPQNESDVIRIPAIQHFNGSDFSVPLPIPGFLSHALDEFGPDVVHTHHPFLLGDTALRIGASRDVPVVFTHHTQYEKYTHYVPGDSPLLARFVVDLTTGFCNLCDVVIAPSESIQAMLHSRNVTSRVVVIPTGVDVERFASGNGPRFRLAHEIPTKAFLVGHVGRLAPEKNLVFLAEAVASFLSQNASAHFLLSGEGPSEVQVREIFAAHGLSQRLHVMGILRPDELVDAYRAMDVFAFASRTETQGMVISEAMAAGAPVVAIDAAGVREVVRDGYNGRLLAREDLADFASALNEIAGLSDEDRQTFVAGARETAEQFSMRRCAQRALDLYNSVISARKTRRPANDGLWESARRRVAEEWKIWTNVAEAVGDALLPATDQDEASR
jgi:glycosyltransferase involved in cell wall biosynthesis